MDEKKCSEPRSNCELLFVMSPSLAFLSLFYFFIIRDQLSGTNGTIPLAEKSTTSPCAKKLLTGVLPIQRVGKTLQNISRVYSQWRPVIM